MSEISTEQLNQAKYVYSVFTQFLDERNLRYTKYEDDFVVVLEYKGEDMSLDLFIKINPERENIMIIDTMPFKIDNKDIPKMCEAICRANAGMAIGDFEMRFQEGGNKIHHKIGHTYTGSTVSPALAEKLIMLSIYTAEKYDDKFMAVSKGYLAPDKIE